MTVKVTVEYMEPEQKEADSIVPDSSSIVLKKGETKQLAYTSVPDGSIISDPLWESSDPSVVEVDENGKVTAKEAGEAKVELKNAEKVLGEFTVIVEAEKNESQTKETAQTSDETTDRSPIYRRSALAATPTITYQTHVQDIGWQTPTANGEVAGTTGQKKRIEAIRIQVNNSSLNGDIEYSSHIQEQGWQSYVRNGGNSGTTGNSLRMEAIRIRLTGQLSQYYDIYYRVHSAEFGWLGWAKNGKDAGTSGFSYRMEAIQIQLVEKGKKGPLESTAYYQRNSLIPPNINYQTYIQNIGWQNPQSNGLTAGTVGEKLRLEAIRMNVTDSEFSGTVKYSSHIQDIGWQKEQENNDISGTNGQNKRIEAVKIQLTDDLNKFFDVYYRVHSAEFGWLGWTKNGSEAGSSGFSFQMEAIQVQLVVKGQNGPTTSISYYEKNIREKQISLNEYEEVFKKSDFKILLGRLTSWSMLYLKQHLRRNVSTRSSFSAETYRDEFDRFIKRFPIIGSSTHSIINSIGKGALLDYVIIDEASQQDIVPGILGLGCARNVIVVGDRKQLPHVPVLLPNSPSPPAEYYNCEKYSLLDSVCMLFRNMVPVTLLKEHYRCHPKIIQFCNKQFYDNALIPLTVDSGEASLSLVITAKGNHTRNFSNLRELESLEGHYWDGESSRGYIAPYNAQVNLAEKVLPADFVKSTVHKFQGRECDEIVFSTVLDKKRSSQHSRNIAFVDNPELVNVAVSRARNKFTLVTGNDVFERHAGHIAALIRYIKYYADDGEIFESPVISAFDLLYSEYDKSLERLNSRLNSNDSHFKSEQIVACLLRDILSQDSYRSMKFHSQIALNQLVLLERGDFTHREQLFMRNRASCDFVVYYKVGKTPLGVIEVDGGYHLTSVQAERDELKNSILKKCGLPLLRLRTIDSDIEGKLGAFLSGLTG